ncbi:MAG: hypothetical protein IJU66_01025 [Oscillospiraceae bacterium]|nr:hypothetical protein [Oscillospiraceae bacterium]
MGVSELIADCDFIMMASSHIHNGNSDDCRVLSDTFGRNVVSCRNFVVKHSLMYSMIRIQEATFDDESQVIFVSSDSVPVFFYSRRTRYSMIPDGYKFLSDNTVWQTDIHFLAECAERGKLL